MDKLQALRTVFGHSAFRPGQEALIDALLSGRDCLGIMPTGAGKSMCFQIPALVREGITLVISPLISLMKDQVTALLAAGVPAAYINSSLSPAQCSLALERAARGAYRVVYVAPERLLTASFLRFALAANIAGIAVDEAHCVSHWGQDFRPSYLSIPEFLRRLPGRPPVGAFTATATRQVREDIIRLLHLRDPLVRVTGFDRPELSFSVREPKDRDAELLHFLRERPGRSGLIYCATRKNVDKVCDLLRRQGYAAARYHAGMGEEERRTSQDDFQFDRVQYMVATNAFGMGIDKSNVQYVVHYNMPRNLESYYQEAGRAGRDGSEAECLLLYQKHDVMLARFMIEHSEHNEALDEAGREQLRALEHERLKQMTFYAAGRRCLRQQILSYFGEEAPAYCGKCSVCRGEERTPACFAPAAAASLLLSAQEQRFGALRALRNLAAKEKGIPAYAVFTDATLREMLERMPRDEEELLALPGVGEKKLRSFGRLFLGFLPLLEGLDDSGSREWAQLAQAHFDGRLHFTREEVNALLIQVAQGVSLRDIAHAMKRPPEIVAAKLKEMKLMTRC